MREMKFRVWDKVTKQMFTGFHLFGEMTLVGGIHAWQAEEAEKIGIKRNSLGALNDLIEMQYTGLKDKNGKEIYEGDWMKDSFGSIGLVEWMPEHMGFMFRNNIGKGWLHPLSSGMDAPTLEIIGNIYENPELL